LHDVAATTARVAHQIRTTRAYRACAPLDQVRGQRSGQKGTRVDIDRGVTTNAQPDDLTPTRTITSA
jgi:hypothetical protein